MLIEHAGSPPNERADPKPQGSDEQLASLGRHVLPAGENDADGQAELV